MAARRFPSGESQRAPLVCVARCAVVWTLLLGGLLTNGAVRAQERAAPLEEPGPEDAGGPSPYSASLRMDEGRDGALLERIRGQTVDLAVDLSVVALTELEPTLSAQLGTADRIASESGSSAVIWFEPHLEAGFLLVTVAIKASGRVLIRRVDYEPGQLPDSAALESAALVVRGALAALIAGAAIGEDREEVIRAAEREVAPVEPDGPSAVLPEASARPGLSLHASLGWRVGWHGPGAWFHGLHGGGAIRAGVFEMGLSGVLGFSNELRNGAIRWTATRHDAVLHAGIRGEISTAVRLGLLLGGGIAFFAREVLEVQAGYQATPNEVSISSLFMATLRLDVIPAGFGGFGFSTGVDLCYLPGAPNYGSELGSDFDSARQLWKLAPGAFAAMIF